VTVREPRPTDAPAIRALQSLLAAADPGLIDTALEGPFRCRVAEADDRVVGYAVALPGRETVLSELAVHPDHRRSGHGRRLVAAVAGDADRVTVTTPVENDAAVAFYASLGFSVEERLPAYYADDSDALRLVRG